MPDSSTKPIALITGASGFVGRYLARHLLEVSDWTLALVSRNEAGAVRLADEYARYPDRVAALAADISDAKAVQEALARTCPSYVFHLAAQTSVKDAPPLPWATTYSAPSTCWKVLVPWPNRRDCWRSARPRSTATFALKTIRLMNTPSYAPTTPTA